MPFATAVIIDIVVVKVFLIAFILVVVVIHSIDTTATQDILLSPSLSGNLLNLQQATIIVTATTED